MYFSTPRSPSKVDVKYNNMNVFVNQIALTLEQNSTLIQLLELNQLSNKKGIAVAVNNVVISKQQWSMYTLNENDKVTIITATQGG